MTNSCKVCCSNLFNEPIFSLDNMPKSAQGFAKSKSESIENSSGILVEVFQCSSCGLVQLNNEPVPYYKDVIRAAGYSQEMKEYRIKQFSKFLQDYDLLGKKVLEVGCGRGEYLTLMKESGALAYGIEHSQESVMLCNDRGLDVNSCYLDSSFKKIPDAPFDAFFILNFLEHVPEINQMLQAISSNITNDAVGIIEVPNFDMMLQNDLFSEFIPDHLFYFTKETLSSTLEKNKFEVISCENTWYNYITSAVVRKKIDKDREKTDLSGFYKKYSTVKEQLNKYVDSFEDQSVAVYGAGHQALAIMAITGIGNKLKYVIDDATFKQNRYTPATHLEIVPYERVKKDQAKAIIVMAASYSDEVVKKIKRDKLDINLSILREEGLEIIENG